MDIEKTLLWLLLILIATVTLRPVGYLIRRLPPALPVATPSPFWAMVTVLVVVQAISTVIFIGRAIAVGQRANARVVDEAPVVYGLLVGTILAAYLYSRLLKIRLHWGFLIAFLHFSTVLGVYSIIVMLVAIGRHYLANER